MMSAVDNGSSSGEARTCQEALYGLAPEARPANGLDATPAFHSFHCELFVFC